jgi:SAM-dependent methyltransferase
MENEMTQGEQWHISGDAAALYERYVVRHILGPWAASLVDAARLEPGQRVLDVACGTGAVTRIAAQRVGRSGKVYGLDLNPAMLAVARALPNDSEAPVEWIARSALDLGLPDRSIDVVLCQQGLQFFPDKPLALREMHRVLDAGGRLALSVWSSTGIYNSAVGNALREFLGDEVATRFCASRKAPGKEELRRLAIDAGFTDVEVRVSSLQAHLPALDTFVLCHLASTPVASVLGDAGEEVRQKIAARVEGQLQDHADADGVTYPEETYLLTGQT